MNKKFVDIILLDKFWNILLLKRNQYDSFFPGTWCLPGGHLEDYGDEGINARRECYEETNIVCTDTHKLMDYTYKDKKTSTVVFYACQGKDFTLEDRSIKLSTREHSEYKWVSFDDLPTIDLMGELYDLLHVAYKKLHDNDVVPI